MNENIKIDTEEAKKIIHIFKELHKVNSRYYGGDWYCLEHLDSSKDNENYDRYFETFKSSLVCYLEFKYKDEELSSELSFIVLKNDVNEKFLNLKEYSKIVKSSKSFFEYFLELIEFGNKEKCRIDFSAKDLDTFCSKYFYINFKYNNYLVDIKEIEPNEYWYPHKNEKERFWEIDKLWSEFKDRDAIRKSREFLTYYLESARGKVLSNKDAKSKEMENILHDLVSAFKIEGLFDDLNTIINKFREIRNKLGKTEASESEEQEKLVKEFENSPHRSISTRLLIDLLKALHNALIVMEKMNKENK